MSFFKQMQSRKIQKKANNFIKTLNSKSTKEVEQAYLDNKEFENNEIVFKLFILLARKMCCLFQKCI